VFVAFDLAGIPRLEDPGNFRALKIVYPANLSDHRTVLSAVGRSDEAGYLWVERAWLEKHSPRDAAWQKGFEDMVTYAASLGWVDDAGSIRAHIEPG
jgi:hypothetical protein